MKDTSRDMIASAAMFSMLLIASPAFAQTTPGMSDETGSAGADDVFAETWTAPNGAFSIGIPWMWNPVANSDPDVMLFLRSLGSGPSGPSMIACTLNRGAVPAQGISWTREHINGMAQVAFEQFLEDENEPRSSIEMVDGYLVGAYETSEPPERGLRARRFGRFFLRREGGDVARYFVMCGVTTRSPGLPGDYAVTQLFLDSLHINPEPTP